MKPIALILLLLLPLAASRADDLVKNGKFTEGVSHWTGGKAVTVDESGQIVTAGGFPALELTADKNTCVSAEQRILTKPQKSQMMVTVVVKSLNFSLNKDSKQFNADFDIGGTYGRPKLVFPKADFCIRIDDAEHRYRPVNFVSNGDWQTVTAKFNVKARGNINLVLLFGPGVGSVLIRSVTMEEAD